MQDMASAPRMALLSFAALASAMGIGRFAFTPLLPMMRAEGLLNVAEAGWLASIHFLGYAIGAFLAGRLTSAPRFILSASLAAIGVATLAMGVTESFIVWLLARWIAGVCSAFILVLISNHVVKSLAEAKRPDLRGLVFAGVGSGIALIGLLTLALMAFDLSSRIGWTICGILVLCVAAPAVRSLPDGGKRHAPSSKHQFGRSRINWYVVLPYGAVGFGYIIPATYLPIMAQASISSPLVFGWGWPIFGVAAALSTVLAVRLVPQINERTIWFAGQLVMAAGLLLPAVWPNLACVIIGGICVGGTFMVITMAGMAEAHRIAAGGDPMPQIAAATAAFAIGQMVGPSVAGMAYGMWESFSAPLVLASGCLALSVFMLLRGQAVAAAGANAGG